jgi:hypothetical protein
MPTTHVGPRSRHRRRRPKKSTLTVQRYPITAAALPPQVSVARICDCCLRPSPRLSRHVEQIGGGGVDCCPRCFRWLTGESESAPTPAQKVARSHWWSLFRQSSPRVACGLGGRPRAVLVLSPIAATSARIGAERRAHGYW